MNPPGVTMPIERLPNQWLRRGREGSSGPAAPAHRGRRLNIFDVELGDLAA